METVCRNVMYTAVFSSAGHIWQVAWVVRIRLQPMWQTNATPCLYFRAFVLCVCIQLQGGQRHTASPPSFSVEVGASTGAPVPASTPVASGPVPSTPVATGPVPSTPLASGPVPDTPVASTPMRTRGEDEEPMWDLWPLPNLKAECARLAGRRASLKYGPLPEQVLASISNQNRGKLIYALTKRAEWRESLDLDPEWYFTPRDVTPQKKKMAALGKVAKALRKKAGPKISITPTQMSCCRLVCLMLDPVLFELYVKSKGGAGRDEQDAKATGANHQFYVEVAKAMATVGWESSTGNAVSIPDTHEKDALAPDTLKSHLAIVDLEGAAAAFQRELRTVFGGDKDAFYHELQKRCFKWIKDIKAHHTVRVVLK